MSALQMHCNEQVGHSRAAAFVKNMATYIQLSMQTPNAEPRA